MSYKVIVLPEAEGDVDQMYLWLAERSLTGAVRWYERFLTTIRSLAANPEIHGLAPEADRIDREICQTFFRTQHGHTYRILFTVAEATVYVLHVRGPGQELLGPEELRSS